ncbi:bifunctional diguanylate cyclase/phosphodiesterase [Pelomonas sp. SE-A7]|uniref:putative bifunctional diguanylate cyclase/phosphodiesterase n=1 Tax=Pelomonas sp. SE-A7 TaxID=3054953 RepID=UPI00259CC973|nr:bifunctional diguanylate cyclase/phosphodiesterase [Pelomonas sp. SE-A7]MDM4766287.1 EAL domain-containing protein [Pelomonas sp. SE-A7]
MFRNITEDLLNATTARLLPVVVFVVAALTGLWHLSRPEPATGTPLPLVAWQEPADLKQPLDQDLAYVRARLAERQSATSVSTQRSTDAFWIGVKAQAPAGQQAWSVEFPSRHSMALRCWDEQSGELLGSATRSGSSGAVMPVRGGFALTLDGERRDIQLLCRSNFRGPAKIAAARWQAAELDAASAQHQKTATMIEAGLGLLALSMALTAAINKSRLYWAFIGWLMISMRMALLSEGSDFSFFGMPIAPEWLTLTRQWTLCLYFVTTIAVFGLLFRKEMAKVGGGWLLPIQRASTLLLMGLCAVLSYEQILPVLWVGTALLWFATLPYLYRIVRRTRSRTAMWYASSLVVALGATLNEIVVASTGQSLLLGALNSVTAALASGVLASAAVAEHMRSDRRRAEQAQKTLKAAYNDSPIGLFTVHDGLVIANANPAFKSMLATMGMDGALTLDELFEPDVALAFGSLHSAGQSASFDLQARLLPPGGGEYWCAIKASTVDGRIIEGSLQDITERVRATTRLEFLVNHDPLTECLNLRGLSRKFERSLTPPRTLAYFDLDRFKLINDLYGHSAGDAVLKQVCERIRSQLGPLDLLARVGGDEFVVAFPDASITEASQRCQNILALISSAPFQIDVQRFALSVSGGLVAAESFGAPAMKEIVSAADTLCRMAKKKPSDRLVVMDGGDTFFKHHKDELALISCLERGETPEGLFLMMQPELSLSRPFDSLNFEVLLRMRKPNGDIVPAQIIIEAAEAHAKTAIIDRWVVTTVISWLEAHAGQLLNTQFVGVNLSGSSLNDEAFVEDLLRLFNQHQEAVARICIEITETVALNDMAHMQRFIDRARDLGVKVALDDFGAGYSSFGYLKGLSVDALKLDGSLVRDAANNPSGMAVLSALGGLVNNLGMKSIGEYAENLPILKALVSAGVDYAQGYGISRPVLPERILEARSAADFIEDPEIYAFVRQLQGREQNTMPLFPEQQRGELLASGLLH